MNSKSKKGQQPDGPFVIHSREMRASIAWRYLPMNARRIIDSLEMEHMDQGGSENGRLKRTYADFKRDGVPKKAIPLAIRQVEALGFAEVTFRALPSIAEHRRCSEYRLTYLSGRGRDAPAMTHDWRAIVTTQQAREALLSAKKIRSADHVRRATRIVSGKPHDQQSLGRQKRAPPPEM